MKTSSTKRMLAFWLAVAILGAPTSGAFAAEMATLQPTVQAEESAAPSAPAAVNIDHIKLSKDNATVNGTAPDSVTATAYSAAGDDENNKIDNSQITWSISGPDNSVTISNTTNTAGQITIPEKAKAGNYTITATPKTATVADATPGAAKTVNLEVKHEASKATKISKVYVDKIEVDNDKFITIVAGSATKAITADVLDQYDDKMSNVSLKFTAAPDSKVTATDGKLTVPQETTEGDVTVTVSVTDNDSINKSFKVKIEAAPKKDNTLTVTFKGLTNIAYTGEALKQDPEIVVKSGDNTLTDGKTEYTYYKKTADAAKNAQGAGFDKTQVKEVGTYHVVAKYTSKDSTKVGYAEGDFQITPKEVTVTAKADTKISKVYDGTATLTSNLSDSHFDITDKIGNDTLTITPKSTGLSYPKADAGTYTVNIPIELSGTSSPNYTLKAATVPVTAEITKGTFNGTKTCDVFVFADKTDTYTFDLPTDVAGLAGLSASVDGTSNGTVIEKAEIKNNQLVVTTKSVAANTKQDISIKVTCQNYLDFVITYTITASSKTNVSDNIQFADKTFTHDAKPHKLDDAQLTGVAAGTNPKWTYTYTKVQTKDAADTTKMPEFSEIGVYQITATYEDDKNFGQKTATLKIEAPAPTSSITVTAEQRKGLIDENYKNFSISLRDETTGYVRIRADANDYLDRQKINDTYSEWIGLEITPKVNGSTSSIENFYVSTNGASWNKISKGTYGNFYLDGVQGYSFYLWYDTDDRDCADDLYLATDDKGANKFQIHVDFDSYSSSSDSGSSGSTSSSTDKVNGDKVSTTTIDKTPSVKGNSATVSISSSALSDALEKNKKESKHEHADKSFIELDVKTSKSVDDTTVTVPVKSLDKISDEDTGLSLVTNQGTIQLDYRALSKIVSAADKNEVSISIEEDKSNQYTLMVKDGSHEIIDLGSGEAELTFSYKLKSGEKASDVKVYRVGDGSKTWLSTYGGSTVYAGTGTYAAATGSYITNMNADYNSSKKKVTFATDALGTFLVTTDTLQTGGTSTPGTSYPSYPSYPSNSTFVDVPASRWSAQYINKLASLGVVNGTGGGYFEPTLYVTREEFVKMLAGVAGANVSGYTSQRFPDVSASRWSAPYIAWAVDHGITTGTDGGKFAPTMKITREEMATMIYRYTQSAGKVLPTKNVPTVFSDAHRIDSWAQTPVSVMQQAGIIDGNVVNGRYSFDPKVPATREECAKMLCLLYDLI